jgi:hypothetical protein
MGFASHHSLFFVVFKGERIIALRTFVTNGGDIIKVGGHDRVCFVLVCQSRTHNSKLLPYPENAIVWDLRKPEKR